MERPKPITERRWPVWIQFLLGTAGIAVTAAGLYELARTPQPEPPGTPIAIQQNETPSERSRRAEAINTMKQQRMEALKALEAQRVTDMQRRGARCMGGVWIVKEGTETRSAGPCTE